MASEPSSSEWSDPAEDAEPIAGASTGRQPRLGSRFRRALTDDELKRIDDAIRTGFAGEGGPAAGIRAMWDIILRDAEGVSWGEQSVPERRYDVRDYAIPARQEQAILARLYRGQSRGVRNSIGFAWLDVGPAVFDDDEHEELFGD